MNIYNWYKQFDKDFCINYILFLGNVDTATWTCTSANKTNSLQNKYLPIVVLVDKFTKHTSYTQKLI